MGSKSWFKNKATITPDQRFCELIESSDSSTFKFTDQKSVATQFNGINTKKRTWIFRAFLTLLLCSVVAEGAVLLFWARRCANSEIDQKRTTTEKQFTSQPDITNGRKTDTALVSRSFMDSTFEIPTSTSLRILSTGIPTKRNGLSTTEYSLSIPITHLDTIATKTSPRHVETTDTITLDATTTDDKRSVTTNLETPSSIFSAKNTTAGSRGRTFIVLFTKNIAPTIKSIYVTSENGTQINISTSPNLDSGLKNQTDKCLLIPSNKRFVIPTDMELLSFKKEVKSLWIETSNDAFIISRDEFENGYSVGSTTHIPLRKLSTRYVVITTDPEFGSKSQIAVAAIEDNTTISVTFRMKKNHSLNINEKTFYNGEVFTLTLSRFETYLIEHDTDLTGTVIESDLPIATFSGNDCNTLNKQGGCDHLIEQIPPVSSVDRAYIVPPNSPDRDTCIRITAIEPTNFTFNTDGFDRGVALDGLESFDLNIASNESCTIDSNRPILVTSFSLHSKTSDLGDPSMVIVPGVNQYLDYYKIVVPSGYDYNYVSIIIKEGSKNSLQINESGISPNVIIFDQNVLVGNTKYSVRSINVTEGELTASSVDGERFGLMFAGVKDFNSYGFSGNSLLV